MRSGCRNSASAWLVCSIVTGWIRIPNDFMKPSGKLRVFRARYFPRVLQGVVRKACASDQTFWKIQTPRLRVLDAEVFEHLKVNSSAAACPGCRHQPSMPGPGLDTDRKDE